MFTEIVTYVLTERAIGRIGQGWLTRDDKEEWESLRADLLEELAGRREVHRRARRALADPDAGDPAGAAVPSPSGCGRPAPTRRCSGPTGDAWTVSDVPLLDELVDLLGRDKTADKAAEQAAARRAAGRGRVRRGRLATIEAGPRGDGRGRHAARPRTCSTPRTWPTGSSSATPATWSNGPAADRDWTYRHVVVDEAQELSEMDWRVLMRRCPGRSFTVVGDLAQRRSAAGARSWDAMLEPYVPGRWVYRSLTVNYRTPAEIMAVAAALLAEFAPGVRPPESVRPAGAAVVPAGHRGRAARGHRGVRPRGGRATRDQRRDRAAGGAGRGARVGDQGPGVRRGAGGGSGGILADSAADLYVALTRATQRLGVLHEGALPPALSGLAEVVRS